MNGVQGVASSNPAAPTIFTRAAILCIKPVSDHLAGFLCASDIDE